jgi:hypothetical protein
LKKRTRKRRALAFHAFPSIHSSNTETLNSHTPEPNISSLLTILSSLKCYIIHANLAFEIPVLDHILSVMHFDKNAIGHKQPHKDLSRGRNEKFKFVRCRNRKRCCAGYALCMSDKVPTLLSSIKQCMCVTQPSSIFCSV